MARLSGFPTAFNILICAGFEKYQNASPDSFRKDFTHLPILLFQRNEGMAKLHAATVEDQSKELGWQYAQRGTICTARVVKSVFD
jgi:hypothetical protein